VWGFSITELHCPKTKRNVARQLIGALSFFAIASISAGAKPTGRGSRESLLRETLSENGILLPKGVDVSEFGG
jgi:hypothetical protein